MEKRTSLLSLCLNVVTTKFWTSNWCPQDFKVKCSLCRDAGVEKLKNIYIRTEQFAFG